MKTEIESENYLTKKNYPAFKKLYLLATKEDWTTFDFEGQEILTSYAKYVVELVDGGR